MCPRYLPIFLSVSLSLLLFGCDDEPSAVDEADAEASEDADPQEDTDPGEPDTDPGEADADPDDPDTDEPGPTYDCDNPHPNWLFCEDFTYGDGDYETWFDHSEFLTALGGGNRDRIDLSSDEYRTGGWSVHMPAADEDHRGADLVWYACEGEPTTNCQLRGYDRLYFRTWVRFAEDHTYVHHFLGIRGLDRFWEYGSAGCLPNGESVMGTTVDFDRNTHETFFYTYHMDMGCDQNCGNYMDVTARCDRCDDIGMPTCDEVEQCCWGNSFRPDPPVALPTDEWFCLEMMMEANTPGEADGEMAYWINDELGHEVEGIRWRSTEDLQLNRVRLQHYIESADSPNRVWFDDVVVSTERIGCD